MENKLEDEIKEQENNPCSFHFLWYDSNMNQRRKTKEVRVGSLSVGGDAPVSVQSMCNTDTRDIKSTIVQIKKLEKAGCEIIRVAVPDMKAAKALGKIKEKIKIPLVADVHFSHLLALESIRQGIDKLRINPGNIGSKDKIKEVAKAAKNKGISIRIGINAGSIEKDILRKYGEATSEAMVESALRHIEILENNDFYDIIIAIKASDIERTIEGYRLLAKEVDYPFHIGITEAGTLFRGTILSSIGIGHLLYEGIGDTIRVSLTDSPVKEVQVGWEILKSLGLRRRGISVTSCPTCGRTEINVIALAKKVEKAVERLDKNITVAVMGCVVNGPGEARDKDLAIIGGRRKSLITKKGKIVRIIKEEELFDAFMEELRKI